MELKFLPPKYERSPSNKSWFAVLSFLKKRLFSYNSTNVYCNIEGREEFSLTAVSGDIDLRPPQI